MEYQYDDNGIYIYHIVKMVSSRIRSIGIRVSER